MFFVAARFAAGEVVGGRFRGEEQAGYSAVGGEEGADGGRAHKGGDAGEVDDAGFVGTIVRGGDRGSVQGFALLG